MELRRYPRFASYQEFEAFDAALTQQLGTGQLRALAPPAATPFAANPPDAWYQLAGTLEVWVLSAPDNAWRGYFLPAAEALAQQRRARRHDQRRRLGCGLLLLAGALAAWLLGRC